MLIIFQNELRNHDKPKPGNRYSTVWKLGGSPSVTTHFDTNLCAYCEWLRRISMRHRGWQFRLLHSPATRQITFSSVKFFLSFS